ncbi:penicillin-binding transpeptidase domain-containing protein [Pseudokineococcus sp. 1T1Z-3]|uniref:penicillin-binding transpeptidase domain-containing protein n=1 Tax=Pseudokineococcus sp. 1T1Z-3 TaxID=3132745 RepID=UPI0030A342FB
MESSRRRTVLIALLGTMAAAAVAAGVVGLLGRADAERDAAARAAAQAVVDGWGAWPTSPAQVEPEGGGTADDVARAYAPVVAGMGGRQPGVVLVDVEREEETAAATLEVRWSLPGTTEAWVSETTLPLTATGDDRDAAGWTATWSASVVAPELTDGDALRLDRVRPERGTVLDRDGAPLVVDRPVVDVQVDPARVGDAEALAQQLSEELGVDAASLAERVVSAPEGQAVSVITLRQEAWDAVSGVVGSLPGVQVLPGERPLAPTTDFARALLGTVGDATAEAVQASDGRVAAGDAVGLSGLQLQEEGRLGGDAGTRVVRVPGGADDATDDGASDAGSGDGGSADDAPDEVLYEVDAVDGQDVQVSLDQGVQVAADEALAAGTPGGGQGALVVVDAASGDLLAVSSAPASGLDRALQGRYAPGSTFKAVSTQALLATGLSPDDTVPCPASITVNGRTFVNADDAELGPVPFAQDFAQSCNTAFASLADDLDAGALAAAAEPMGLGIGWGLGVPVFTGEVPEAATPDVRAAEMIGQGQVLASPAGMAVATATIARGAWVAPRLLLDPAPSAGQTPPEPVADLAVVRDLMRLVASEGTAAGALADVPGEPVGAKTGTAEVGEAGPDGRFPTNAWTIAFQPGTGPAGPDGAGVAVAVVVEGGERGSTAAAPVVADLLTRLAAQP